MRFGSPLSLLLAALAGQGLTSRVFATPSAADVDPAALETADALPEVLEFSDSDFHERTSNGYWFVKHYSPTCPSCLEAAPIWKKTVHNFVTKTPSYRTTYNFQFASLNCAAYGDICGEKKIQSYPTFLVYKNGKEVDRQVGVTQYDALAAIVDKWVGVIKDEKVNPPKATPNSKGMSVPLDSEAFTKSITTTRDAWFVKFYAPWCGHCQAMAPAWAELGIEMKGKLNIGEVNCEAEKRLCKDVKLSGYPTILYFQNGERVEYDGLRGLGDLVNYARKAVDSGVKKINDAGFKELEKAGNAEVAFIYFYDHAAVSEDFEALDRLTLNLIGHAPLFATDDDDMAARFRVYSRPRIIVVRDGKPSYYPALAPHDLRDYGRVLSWMKSVWLPLVPELSAANSHEIMNNKIVVLGILNREKADDFNLAKKELKMAAVDFMASRLEEENIERKNLRTAKQVRLEEAEDRNDERAIKAAKGTRIDIAKRKEVGFAWVDGIFWERWVRSTYGVNVNTDGPRIIINDEENKQYWDQTTEGSPISASRSRILDTLRDITSKSPTIRSKSTSTRIERVFFLVRSGARSHPWTLLTFFVVSLMVLAFWGRGRMRRKAAGFFRIDGKGSFPVAQGKVD